MPLLVEITDPRFDHSEVLRALDGRMVCIASGFELVEQVPGMTKEALDVLPDQRLEHLALDAPTGTAAIEGAALVDLAAAAVPDGALVRGADVGQPAERAGHDAAEKVDAFGDLGGHPMARQCRLGGLPELGRDDAEIDEIVAVLEKAGLAGTLTNAQAVSCRLAPNRALLVRSRAMQGTGTASCRTRLLEDERGSSVRLDSQPAGGADEVEDE